MKCRTVMRNGAKYAEGPSAYRLRRMLLPMLRQRSPVYLYIPWSKFWYFFSGLGPSPGLLISSESDALKLVSFGGENDTDRLLLHAANLHEDFFDLKTGLAGAVLQKFINYGIQTAAVIPPELANQDRSREMPWKPTAAGISGYLLRLTKRKPGLLKVEPVIGPERT